MKPVRTLFLVAGEHDARFLLNDGVGKGLAEVAVLGISQFPEASAEYSDRPGRHSAAAGRMAVHGLDPHQTLDEQHRERFARRVAEALGQQWTAQGPDRLIMAAPPKMLGLLRDAIDGPAAAALLADLPKDLVRIPTHDLPSHFAELIAV
ncbi:MAG: host attachment protein [Paracoccaceae bacterium]